MISNNYEIVFIKDLRRGDKFLWSGSIHTVTKEFRLDPEYCSGKLEFGDFGVLGYEMKSSKYDMSIDVCSDYPVIKLLSSSALS